MPFVAIINAAVPALHVFVNNHISVILFTLTTLGFIGTIEYLHPGYLTLSDARPTGPPFTIGPPIPTEFDSSIVPGVGSEMMNGTCHIITDLTIFQTWPAAIPFWVVFLTQFSFANISAITWEIVAIYETLWNYVPGNVAPFAFLTMYLAATWQIWTIGFAVVRSGVRQLRRMTSKSDHFYRDDGDRSSGSDNGNYNSNRDDGTSGNNGEGEVNGPEVPTKVSNTATLVWKLLARMWRKIATDSERDLSILREANTQLSQQFNVSQYQEQINKLQQELQTAQSNNIAQQSASDEARKNKFDLQIRSKELETAKKNLDASRRNLRSTNAQVQKLEKTQAELTGKIADQETQISSLLQNQEARVEDTVHQVLGLSRVTSVDNEPQASLSQSAPVVISEGEFETDPEKSHVVAEPDDTTTQADVEAPTESTSLLDDDASTMPTTKPVSRPPLADTDAGSQHAPVRDIPVAGSQDADIKTDIMRRNNVAIQKYSEAFPNGITKIWVSPQDWLCGFEAAIKTMEIMYPDRQQPSVPELRAICETPEWEDTLKQLRDAGLSISDYFSPDMLEMALRKWAAPYEYKYRIGYIKPTQNGHLPSLCIGPDDDKYLDDVVWVYIENEVIEGFETGHYYGVQPNTKVETQPAAEEMINLEAASPTGEDTASNDQNISAEPRAPAKVRAQSKQERRTSKSEEGIKYETVNPVPATEEAEEDSGKQKEEEDKADQVKPSDPIRSRAKLVAKSPRLHRKQHAIPRHKSSSRTTGE